MSFFDPLILSLSRFESVKNFFFLCANIDNKKLLILLTFIGDTKNQKLLFFPGCEFILKYVCEK